MADNVPITAGTGTDVATDDVGGIHYQRVKLTDGTADSSTVVAVAGGVEANALRVTIASDSTGLVSVDDNGGSLTVDGTVTAELAAGTNNIGDVDIVSPLGAGTEAAAVRVTVATDSTGVLSVDDNGGTLTVDGTVTADAGTGFPAVYTDDTSTHATGTSTGLGIMAAATPTDGSVAANDIGMVAMSVDRRLHVDAQIAGQDADVSIDDGGNVISVDWNGTAPPIGAGTEAAALRVTVATDSTGVLSVDDNGSSLTVDNATISVVGSGTEATAQRVTIATDSTGVLSVDDNGASLTVDNATISVVGGGTEATAQRVTIASDSTGVLSVDDNSGSLTVDGTVAVSSITTSVTPGTAAANLGKAEDGPHSTGDVGVMALGTANEANTVRGADNDYCPLATDTEGNQRVVGNRDHDAVDAGEVVKVGGVAVSGSATPTSVAAADRTRWIFNQHGIPYVIGGHPNLITREFDFGTAAQTDLNLAAAVVAADERIYVTRFEATCDNANTVDVAVRAGFGTANVPTASATGVSGMIASHPGIAPGSGIICGNGAGILAVGGAGEEPRLTSEAATTGNLHVIFSYFLVDETP